MRSAVLAAGAAAALAGCDDVKLGGGSPSPGGSASKPASATPTRDPAEVAALTAAATRLRQLGTRYAAVAKRHPTLAGRLAKPRALHDAHVAAATARTGQAARLLAMIAASQTQLAVSLGRKAASR